MLGVNPAGQRHAERVEDGAQVFRVVLSLLRTFCVGVVRQLMHVLAQHLLGRVTQLFGTCAVDEGAAAVHVDAEDALAGRFQQL